MPDDVRRTLSVAAMSLSLGRFRLAQRPDVDARRAGLAVLAGFLLPALVVYAGFTLYPVVRTFYNAFHTIRPLPGTMRTR